MPQPYSADLRERVLLAGEDGLSPVIVTRPFDVGLSTVYLWRQQARAGADAVSSRTLAIARQQQVPAITTQRNCPSACPIASASASTQAPNRSCRSSLMCPVSPMTVLFEGSSGNHIRAY
jgi:transposase-like protein